MDKKIKKNRKLKNKIDIKEEKIDEKFVQKVIDDN